MDTEGQQRPSQFQHKLQLETELSSLILQTKLQLLGHYKSVKQEKALLTELKASLFHLVLIRKLTSELDNQSLLAQYRSFEENLIYQPKLVSVVHNPIEHLSQTMEQTVNLTTDHEISSQIWEEYYFQDTLSNTVILGVQKQKSKNWC